MRYLNLSRTLADPYTDTYTFEDAQSALLTGIFLVERNNKSAAWIWLGHAVRICQLLGLHYESGTHDAMQTEMCRRLWWCVYGCEQ